MYCLCVYLHTYVCMYMHMCVYVCICICILFVFHESTITIKRDIEYVKSNISNSMYVFIYLCLYIRNMYVYVCMYVCMYVCVYFFILFIVILHAPLLWINTTCIGGFLHNYIISSKIPCSIYKFIKLVIIVYNLSKGILFINFLKYLLNLLINFFLHTGQFSVHNASVLDCLFPARVVFSHTICDLLFVLHFCRSTLGCLRLRICANMI